MRRGLQRLIGVLLFLFVVSAMAFSLSIFRRTDAAEAELSALRLTADSMRRENEKLRFGIEHALDSDTLSAVARDRLGLVLPEDTIFIEFEN